MADSDLPPELVAKIEKWGNLPGWAPQHKMRDMASLILRERPALVVEIGVFGGRSALPQIAALAANGTGRFVGIDPYEASIYDEGEKTQEEEWMRTYNYAEVRAAYLAAVAGAGFGEVASLLQVPAVTAAADGFFADNSIGVLHVDGCHYADVALRDTEVYWPKVAAGGHVWMDDTNWSSLQPALSFLESQGAELVKDYGHFRLYRKPA